MCLAVPGQIISIKGEARLAFVPEAVEGDYVLVHAGVAISVLREDAAVRTLGYLEEIE